MIVTNINTPCNYFRSLSVAHIYFLGFIRVGAQIVKCCRCLCKFGKEREAGSYKDVYTKWERERERNDVHARASRLACNMKVLPFSRSGFLAVSLYMRKSCIYSQCFTCVVFRGKKENRCAHKLKKPFNIADPSNRRIVKLLLVRSGKRTCISPRVHFWKSSLEKRGILPRFKMSHINVQRPPSRLFLSYIR